MFGAEQSGRMISYLNGAICFIPALAPILGSYITQQLGWRSNFSFMGCFAIVGGILLFIGMKETNPVKEKQNVFTVERYWSVLSNSTFLFHAVLCTISMSVILAYVTSAPIVLMNQMGLNMNEFTHWFGINAVINILAAFFAPKLMDKKGLHKALVIGIVIMFIAGVLMLILPSHQFAWAFMLPIFLSSIGFALVLGTSVGKALSPFEDKAGTAAALVGVFQMSGASVVVAIMQRLNITAQNTIALQMLCIVPALFFLLSNQGKSWHNAYR